MHAHTPRSVDDARAYRTFSLHFTQGYRKGLLSDSTSFSTWNRLSLHKLHVNYIKISSLFCIKAYRPIQTSFRLIRANYCITLSHRELPNSRVNLIG